MDVGALVASALTSTDPQVAVGVGNELYDASEFEAAVACFRHAVMAGADWALINLGNALQADGRGREAVDAFGRAAAAGDIDAWLNLGSALEAEGDLGGALAAYTAGSRAGDQQASMLGAFLLMEIDEPEAAEVLAATAVDQGSVTARGMLAHWRWETSLDPAQEADLRAGANDYPPARVSLADLLASVGRADDAIAVLNVGVQRGEAGCFLPLGNLYADHLNRPELAEATFRAGIDAGDTHCFHNLGVLLADMGRPDEARELLARGAQAGDTLAARTLRQLDDKY